MPLASLNPKQKQAALALAGLLAAAALGYGLYRWLAPSAPPAPVETEFTRVESTPVMLMDAFPSYSALETVRQRLSAAGMAWEAERSHAPEVPGRPPYNFDTLIVGETRHLGCVGSVTLEFFNDRLFRASFQPQKPKDYLAALRRSGLALERLRADTWERREGELRIASNIEYAISETGRHLGTEPAIRWEDSRLVAQIGRWYETHGRQGLIAPPP